MEDSTSPSAASAAAAIAIRSVCGAPRARYTSGPTRHEQAVGHPTFDHAIGDVVHPDLVARDEAVLVAGQIEYPLPVHVHGRPPGS